MPEYSFQVCQQHILTWTQQSDRSIGAWNPQRTSIRINSEDADLSARHTRFTPNLQTPTDAGYHSKSAITFRMVNEATLSFCGSIAWIADVRLNGSVALTPTGA